jgi:hypothetical protein
MTKVTVITESVVPRLDTILPSGTFFQISDDDRLFAVAQIGRPNQTPSNEFIVLNVSSMNRFRDEPVSIGYTPTYQRVCEYMGVDQLTIINSVKISI